MYIVVKIHRLNFERPNFERLNFERLNFERPNFERPNFELPALVAQWPALVAQCVKGLLPW
jgi:hypothetical protein